MRNSQEVSDPSTASYAYMTFTRRDLWHWFVRGGLRVTARTDSPNLEMASADWDGRVG